VKINAYVEAVMIPIRFVVPAPPTVRIHFRHVMVYLSAVLAMAARIAIDPGPISFQPPLAIVFPIPIRAGSSSKRKENPAG
jgi:hypothetical protein